MLHTTVATTASTTPASPATTPAGAPAGAPGAAAAPAGGGSRPSGRSYQHGRRRRGGSSQRLKAARARYATERAAGTWKGRSLVLVDLENLCGPAATAKDVTGKLRRLVEWAGIGEGDHVVVAGHSRLLFNARSVLPGARLLVSRGSVRDSADLALLGALEEAEGRFGRESGYGRVVFASGDHIFAPAAERLSGSGVLVEVAGPTGATSGSLRKASLHSVTLGPSVRSRSGRARAAA